MMKHLPRLLALACCGAALAGCTTDQVMRGIYSSFRVQNQAVELSMPGPPRTEPVAFDRYQQERKGELKAAP